MKNTNQPSNRVFSMDLLRVIACYMVIQIHSGEFYYIGDLGSVKQGSDPHWVNLLNSLFRSCVPLFVLITGYFVLPLKDSMGVFFKKRLTRVVIPFVIWCVLYALYFFFQGKADWNQTLINISHIPVNFGVEIGHLWYIYMLIGLYLFFPIISPWLNVASKKNVLFYLSVWAITLCLPYIHLVYKEIWGECFWNPTPMLYYFTGFLGYAILGFYIKKFCSQKSKLDFPIGIALVIVGYLITYFVFDANLKTKQLVSDLELSWGFGTINVAMMTLGITLLVKNITCQNESLRATVTNISNLTYGIYLAHIMILNMFYSLINDHFDTALVKIPMIAICTFVTTTIFIKAISYLPKSKYLIG